MTDQTLVQSDYVLLFVTNFDFLKYTHCIKSEKRSMYIFVLFVIIYYCHGQLCDMREVSR